MQDEAGRGEVSLVELGIALKNTYYGGYAGVESEFPAAVRRITTGYDNCAYRVENGDSLNIACSDKEIYNPCVKTGVIEDYTDGSLDTTLAPKDKLGPEGLWNLRPVEQGASFHLVNARNRTLLLGNALRTLTP